MAPFDVDDLVAEHAGQFVGGLCPFDQTGKDID
jgi:hypothetical protein